MIARDGRAHGVTPGLSQDYASRTADRQAAFLMPHLRPGMRLLDLGCGPGSITLGLARAVAPGLVTGIDHDPENIQSAKALAIEQGLGNVIFETGDALNLPYEDESFDAAFENNLFTHLSEKALQAAREVYRVLKSQAFFAARDVDASSVVWGNVSKPIKLLDRLMTQWQSSRGSDIILGRRLPSILREAGFTNTLKSVSADTKGTHSEVQSHAEITITLLDGPFGEAILQHGWADRQTLEELKETIRAWGTHPDAFFANIHVEVIGWKPAV